MKDSVYDTDTLAVPASSEFDVEVLKEDVQVVVNLISDADQAKALLPLVADLAVAALQACRRIEREPGQFAAKRVHPSSWLADGESNDLSAASIFD